MPSRAATFSEETFPRAMAATRRGSEDIGKGVLHQTARRLRRKAAMLSATGEVVAELDSPGQNDAG
jgi:hypothetical protein